MNKNKHSHKTEITKGGGLSLLLWGPGCSSSWLRYHVFLCFFTCRTQVCEGLQWHKVWRLLRPPGGVKTGLSNRVCNLSTLLILDCWHGCHNHEEPVNDRGPGERMAGKSSAEWGLKGCPKSNRWSQWLTPWANKETHGSSHRLCKLAWLFWKKRLISNNLPK